MGFENIQKVYGVPVKKNGRIEYKSKLGTIVGCFRRNGILNNIKNCIDCENKPRSKECVDYICEHKRFLFTD